STGKEFAPPPKIDVQAPARRPMIRPTVQAQATVTTSSAPVAQEIVRPARTVSKVASRALKFEDMSARALRPYEGGAVDGDEEEEESGFFGRFMGMFRGKSRRPGEAQAKIEMPRETKEEFEARTSLRPPGIPAQTY